MRCLCQLNRGLRILAPGVADIEIIVEQKAMAST